MIVIWLLLAVLCVGSAVMVVMLDNPVHSALSLVLTLLCVAGMYAMLNAPFVAIVQVAVYAGAIMVLFLFVIMLLNLRREEGAARASRPAMAAGVLFAGALAGALCTAVGPIDGRPSAFPAGFNSYNFGSPQHIGMVLFGPGLLPFEVTSLLLTVAMVGAILLARRKF